MTHPSQPEIAIRPAAGGSAEPRGLAVQTLRMVAILVGACVLFVGALSAAAVAITSKAVGASASPRNVEASGDEVALPNKSGPSRSHAGLSL